MPCSTAQLETNTTLCGLTIEPPAAEWEDLVSVWKSTSNVMLLGRSTDQWKTLTRQQLFGSSGNLDTIVATGHQASWWHAGILAKYFATQSFANAIRADAIVELTVDQDANDPSTVQYPDTDTDEIYHNNSCHLYPHAKKGIPLALQSASSVLPDASAPEIVQSISNALNDAYLGATQNRAQQITSANAILRHISYDNLPCNTMRSIDKDDLSQTSRLALFATQLTQTDLWKSLLQYIVQDPIQAVQTYNRAVSLYPDAGMQTLRLGTNQSDDIELPLWAVSQSSQLRQPATLQDLTSNDPEIMLWPRAILMTAMMRLAVCDLFVHGLGGGVYDKVAEQWFQDWLGVMLSPMTVVSATMLLDLELAPTTSEQAAHARWWVHHFKSNLDRYIPDAASYGATKLMLLNTIANAPRKSAKRATAYHKLRALQDTLVHKYRSEIADISIKAHIAAIAVQSNQVLSDRTWAFPFHAASDLHFLQRQIANTFCTLSI